MESQEDFRRRLRAEEVLFEQGFVGDDLVGEALELGQLADEREDERHVARCGGAEVEFGGGRRSHDGKGSGRVRCSLA